MSVIKQPKDHVIIRGPVPLAEIAEGKLGGDFRLVHEMATLCANVYAESNQFSSDWRDGDKRIWLERWEELALKNFDPKAPLGHYKIKGLKYEAWKKQTGSGKTLVALVFRGTDLPTDWYVNLRWFTRFIPLFWDHYEQTKAIVHDIVGEIHGKLGAENVEIVSTGHSLGGGLAHLAAYATPHIKKVFAFNSSPVTGFYSVRGEERRRNKMGIKVYRIFEHGEALAYVRFFMKLLYPVSQADPHVMEVRYDFEHDNIVSQHGMKKLAYNLTNAIDRVAK